MYLLSLVPLIQLLVLALHVIPTSSSTAPYNNNDNNADSASSSTINDDGTTTTTTVTPFCAIQFITPSVDGETLFYVRELKQADYVPHENTSPLQPTGNIINGDDIGAFSASLSVTSCPHLRLCMDYSSSSSSSNNNSQSDSTETDTVLTLPTRVVLCEDEEEYQQKKEDLQGASKSNSRVVTFYFDSVPLGPAILEAYALEQLEPTPANGDGGDSGTSSGSSSSSSSGGGDGSSASAVSPAVYSRRLYQARSFELKRKLKIAENADTAHRLVVAGTEMGCGHLLVELKFIAPFPFSHSDFLYDRFKACNHSFAELLIPFLPFPFYHSDFRNCYLLSLCVYSFIRRTSLKFLQSFN
jgi:hypothetical protein